MIRLENISKTFAGGTQNESRVLHDINLTVKENEFVILAGSNGSGKSTLLNIIAGSVKQDKGSVIFDGKDVSSLTDFQRAKWIARIFQNPLAGTAPDLSVLENFRLASMRTKKKGLTIGTGNKFIGEVKEKISSIGLGLENRIHQQMGSLSGGQRQALSLIMAASDRTRILLLDEPTAALDPKTSVLIMELTKKVIRDFNLTALLVTHNVKDILQAGSRVIQLSEGRIVRDIDQDSKNKLSMNEVYVWFAN
jgi:putative ABC transport system ATP-binding protein